MKIEIITKMELGLEVWIIKAQGIELHRFMSSFMAEKVAAKLLAKYEDAKIVRNDAPQTVIKAA